MNRHSATFETANQAVLKGTSKLLTFVRRSIWLQLLLRYRWIAITDALGKDPGDTQGHIRPMKPIDVIGTVME
jgi:hypothetical protein